MQQAKLSCKTCELDFSDPQHLINHFKKLHQTHRCPACAVATNQEFCPSCTKDHSLEIFKLDDLDQKISRARATLQALVAARTTLLNQLSTKHPKQRPSIYCDHGEVREICARCAKIFQIQDSKRDERHRIKTSEDAEAARKANEARTLTRLQKAKFVQL